MPDVRLRFRTSLSSVVTSFEAPFFRCVGRNPCSTRGILFQKFRDLFFRQDPCPSYENSFPKRSGRWQRSQGKDIDPYGRGRSQFRRRATVAGPGCHINRQFCRSHRPGSPTAELEDVTIVSATTRNCYPFMDAFYFRSKYFICFVPSWLLSSCFSSISSSAGTV